MNWAFYKSSIGNVHVGHLADWLYRIADAASQLVRVTSKSNQKKPEQHNDRTNKPDTSKSNTFVNTQVETTLDESQSIRKSDVKRSCVACGGANCTKLENCKVFTDASLSRRWSMIKKGKICGKCFGLHAYQQCKSSKSCSVAGCKASHHHLLHNYEKSSTTPSSKNQQDSTAESTSPSSVATEKIFCNSQRNNSNQRTDKFRIAPVMLHYKDKSVREYVYMDDGSNMTTMEESLADDMNLVGSTKELCVDWAFRHTHQTIDPRLQFLDATTMHPDSR